MTLYSRTRKEREELQGERAVGGERVEGDGGLPRFIYQAYYIFPKYP
jgi:hypothetical protein